MDVSEYRIGLIALRCTPEIIIIICADFAFIVVTIFLRYDNSKFMIHLQRNHMGEICFAETL